MAVVEMLSPLDAKAVVTAMWKWSSPLDGNVSPLDAKAVVTAMWKRSSPLDGNAVLFYIFVFDVFSFLMFSVFMIFHFCFSIV